MSEWLNTWHGGCHCGNLKTRFVTNETVDALPVRECQCGFCRRHGVRTTTDPNGHVSLTIQSSVLLSRYSHGLGIADFFVCSRCGTYVAAVMQTEDASYATLNINTLTENPFGERRGTAANYAAEDAAGRAARRVRMWTPISISFADEET